MAKVLNAYRMITAATIKANADIPNQGDMTVVGSTVECADITTTKVRNVIGAGNNLFSGLCTAAGINHWAAFSPTKRTISGSGASGEIVNSDPTNNYKPDEFIGYNHAAMTPGWYNKGSAEADIWINRDDTATFIADIKIGEVRYKEELNIRRVILLIYDSGNNIVASGSEDIDDCGETVSLSATTAYGLTSTASYTGKLFFSDTTSGYSAGDILCKVPNVDNFTVRVVVRQPSALVVDSGSFTVTNAGFSSSAGTISFTQAESGSSFTDPAYPLVVKYRLTDALGSTLWEQEIYRGTYTAYSQIYGSLETAPNPPYSSYGYYWRIEFLEPY